MARNISDAEFKNEVIESDVPVLVDFWAPWCGPCKMVGPIIDRVSQSMGDNAKVVKVNVDENPMTAGQYGITSIPTVMIFKHGQIEKQLVGVQQESVYLDALA